MKESSAQQGLRELADDAPWRHDLFVALVAPLGSSTDDVITALTERLTQDYGYLTERIHLAGLLDDVPTIDGAKLPKRTDRNYYEARMSAGDNLRQKGGDLSAVAALAVAAAQASRERRRDGRESQPVAYLFDSLKHPRESDLLRSVYGSAYWLVSIVQDVDEREQNLADTLGRASGQFGGVPEGEALSLMARDEADLSAPHGQHVRDVFEKADFFLGVQRGKDWRKEVTRLLSGIFGAPFISPRADEEAMRHARAAALRSAAIGRQVGAVIVPQTGSPYVVGTNEVPRPGGGQFREGDDPDHRDFQAGLDPNPAYTERLLRELFDRLAKAEYFTEERNAAGGDEVLREAATPDDDGLSLLDGTRAKALIEFTRCLHAEQAAIAAAARSGIAIGGARLFSTTFPCHECTKLIIGAGLVEVQYIEPYPKSLAGVLYRDLVDVRPPVERNGEGKSPLKVPFRPFVGFGPSRYDEVFEAPIRKRGGSLAAHTPREAAPVGASWSEISTQEREDQVVVAIATTVREMQHDAPTIPSAVSEDLLPDVSAPSGA